jgi:mannitol-1-phosphate 5-dehydrogenase
MAKSAVMFGAGNVGRGFLGQLFSESGYEVVFVDVDEALVDALNARRAYTLQLVDNQGRQEITISPVRAVRAGDAPAVSQALAQAGIAATAVGARILPAIAPLVAQGITWRATAANPEPLNIIICENLKGAAATFRSMVGEHIPDGIRPYFQAHIGFVDTVIGRMVPPPTPVMRALDPSLIAVEPYKELPVDRRGFTGPIPAISGMEVCDNFGAYTARKLYIHNCGHAVLAYLGYLRGCQFGYQALEDPLIRPLLEKALAEASAGIVAAYGVQPEWLERHASDLIHRFANRALGDTTFRLGRDPARKLSPDDRLVGAARLAEKAGIPPVAISWGIAAALQFNPPEDSLAIDFQKHLEQAGLDAILAEVCGIQPNEPLAELVRERYQRLSASDWTIL